MAVAEEAAEGGGGDLERRVMEAVKASEERGDPPLARAVEVGRCVQEKGLGFPSPELGHVLVSNLCFSHNMPSLWKLLDQAMASRLIAPLHALALLTPRVIPNRRAEPEAYRLYLELLSRYALSPLSIEVGSCRDKIIKSVDDALQLSHAYGVHQMDFGHMVVLSILSVITSLIDCTLEDCGLQLTFRYKHGDFYADEGHQVMDIDVRGSSDEKRNKHREQLRRTNVLLAIEVVEKITSNKRAKLFLRLIYLNMPEKFNGLLERLQFIESHKSASQALLSANHILDSLSANVQKAMDWEYQLNKHQLLGVMVDAGPSSYLSCNSSGASRAACWISFDMFMENAMDGRQLHTVSAIEILTELTKSLKVINQASWQETFQALWISSLRLIQRDREPLEGPIPHLDARLCMLLSIVPLSIVPLVKEEYEMPSLISKGITRSYGNGAEENNLASRKHGLVSSLQVLGLFSGLLLPPPSVVNAANSAASKAAAFVSNLKTGCVGNMLHLIVEACIARNLIDTSAYFWPGYVVPSAPSKDSLLVQESPWTTFMEGAPLNGSLKNALMVTPATSVVELEKLYNIALNGSEEEKSAAAKILCGASLVRGWNIQEHVVHIVIKLLSPSVPPNPSVSGSGSHLIGHMPMLSAILFGVSCGDIVHILSLFGMEHCMAGRGGPVRSELTLDCLLLMRNSRIALQNSSAVGRMDGITDPRHSTPSQPVYIDSFPKLRAWYFQNQACIASTLSGLCNKNPVHQVANKILKMIYRKMTKAGTVSGNPSSTSSNTISGSPVNTTEDAHQRPTFPAWEFLEAVPFVLEAVLTACAHGRLSSRDLTTGLRDLVDFLPASLATIISYFSAEITRGIWKPVQMNGTDWPSPAGNLLSVESEIKEILASAGIHIASCYPRGMPPMLPLPMAALVSLTITFKLDKSLEYTHSILGQALENCATGSSWPSMPIIGALWTQKVRRWHDFIVLSCSRSPFTRDKDAVAQLIRSCFSSFLGPSITEGSHFSANRGIHGLLGQAMADQGLRLPIAPGFLYLRTCRTFHDTNFVTEVILKLVLELANKLGNEWACSGPARLRSGRLSLAAAVSRVQEVAMLGATLLCIAGGVLLVQVLYEESLPTLLLSAGEEKLVGAGPASNILEGYVMAYMLILSGAFVWGIGNTSPAYTSVYSSRRARVIGIHMDFVAAVMEGNISVGCDPATWKAYVSCFVGLLVSFVPTWVPEVKQGTLHKLASGLRGWHEYDLALSLLERGGPAAMDALVESVL
ncbi:mediator of RNA polymerase II transcription subunit 33A-like isoform X2 [Phoenix dactylifera]|uniref:Mediator of RNA polymerase II transcription subunit 33A-like isoform X2 n=1 Tax=Phoenix dactylifera TaxID=42345 RepID=A0A8B9AR22_PHODC|nr:mediator of RNA polymerase II transcription subunit 33A-like isoform X2 [Phoenix dactylifera]